MLNNGAIPNRHIIHRLILGNKRQERLYETGNQKNGTEFTGNDALS